MSRPAEFITRGKALARLYPGLHPIAVQEECEFARWTRLLVFLVPSASWTLSRPPSSWWPQRPSAASTRSTYAPFPVAAEGKSLPYTHAGVGECMEQGPALCLGDGSFQAPRRRHMLH